MKVILSRKSCAWRINEEDSFMLFIMSEVTSIPTLKGVAEHGRFS